MLAYIDVSPVGTTRMRLSATRGLARTGAA